MTSDTELILSRLARPGAKASELLVVYQTKDHEPTWTADPRLYRAFARRLSVEGHPTRAFELARQGLADHPGDPELLFLLALAMSRGGNFAAAEGHLATLLGNPAIGAALLVEAVSLKGRLWKDRFDRAKDPEKREKFAAQSAERYREAANLPGAGFYPRINAATMSLLAGDTTASQELAREVLAQAAGREDYWGLATRGEAHLLLGDLAGATDWYLKAVAKARQENAVGDIGAMRRNALLIKERLQVSDELIRLFYLGSVVVFAGHMIDRPDRVAGGLTRRFPPDPQLIREVNQEIKTELDNLNATIGICSVACGADILFAEHILAREGELHVVLPYDRADFYATSVDYGLTSGEWKRWRARCDSVLEQATEIHYATTERHLGDDVLKDLNSEFMQGLAILRAAQRGVVPQAMAVWDPASPAHKGGTAHFLDKWQRRGLPATTIDLAKLRVQVFGDLPAEGETAPAERPARATARELKSMLFADVKDFSTLKDPHLPRFFEGYLGEVRDVLGSLASPPLESNTWGDGLYLVFNEVGGCAEAALRLVERGEKIDWEKYGLGKEMPLRIGVHTGPVFRGQCPIREVATFYGSQVTRAARIEPVTMPGCAFASEQFAALLAVEAGEEYVCEYIGVEQLAKQYDKCALYRLGRR